MMEVLMMASLFIAQAVVVPIGTAIERATGASSLLAAAAQIPPPGPIFAQPYLAQDVHQIKRQQLASNALARLRSVLTGSGVRSERHAALRDERLLDLVQCAAEPSSARPDGVEETLDQKSARALACALEALATLCAADAADTAGAERTSLAPLRDGAKQLASRAEALADAMCLSDAVASRWAIRRLLGASLTTTKLDAIAAPLPFDMYPGLVALPAPWAGHASEEDLSHALLPSVSRLVPSLSVAALRDDVAFEQATLLTADGRKVRERRHTAWLGEEGVGALAYSGKLMSPSPLSECSTICSLRDALRADLGQSFDCALANLYSAGGKTACAWHRDPEHGDAIDGAKWARHTFVVSAGESRIFAFRPFREAGEAPTNERDRHTISLFTGDVVTMHGDCNEAWEHSVLPGQGSANEGPRVSLVFKRALVGLDGKRGHTLAGKGRRAKARLREAMERGAGNAAAGNAGGGSSKPRRKVAAAPGRHPREQRRRGRRG